MNKTVFISGSSRGIGAATAKRFAKAGCSIVITYQTGKEEAETVAAECARLGSPQTLILQLDLRSDGSITRAAAETKQKFVGIDILVNNAGVFLKAPLAGQSFAEIHNQIGVNLEGLIKLTREFLPDVKEAIINVSSGIGLVGKKNASVYAATKWAVRGFTKSLAKEMPALRIFAVNPTLTATKMGDFDGMLPEKVADVIYDAAIGKITRENGGDLNMNYYALEPSGKLVYVVRNFIKRVIGK